MMKQSAETDRKRPSIRGARSIAACLLCIPVLFAAGCGLSNREDVSSISVDENGRLTCTIMEPAQAGDTEESVRAFVQERIDAFGGNGTAAAHVISNADSTAESSSGTGAADESTDAAEEQDPETESENTNTGIQIDRCEIRDNEISLSLIYGSYADYAAFNGTDCFFGTVAEAEEAGYSLEGTLLDENEAEADYATLQERAREWKALIFEEPMNVRVPDKILYASENMRITGRLTASYIGGDDEETGKSEAQDKSAVSGVAAAFSETSQGETGESKAESASESSAESGSSAAAEAQSTAEDGAEAGVPREVAEFAVDDFEQIIIIFK